MQQHYSRIHETTYRAPNTQIGTVHNNNPLNPFSSNTTNPKQWGPTISNHDSYNATKDYIELLAYSYFFCGVYWTSLFVIGLVNGYSRLASSISYIILFILTTLIATICYKSCDGYYEYGALEYYQPIKDLLRAGIKRKGMWNLMSGVAILMAVLVFGPFMVGAIAYVDELGGRRRHSD